MAGGLRTYQDAVAIITGGGSGIGKALAGEMARRGAQVVLADIEQADAESVAAQIRSAGGRASARYLDVSDYAGVKALVEDTAREFGRIDYIFNNAGIGIGGEVAKHTIEAWNRIIAVNITGVVNGVQAAYPLMVRQGFGHVVSTASMAGLTPNPGLTAYAMTKHAVVGLSRALRIEAEGHGVRVSVLCPGVIRTPILTGGKHGIFFVPVSEQRRHEIFGQIFERLRPMDVNAFARRVIDQVARNRAIIIVPGWWRLVWWLDRLNGALSSLFARKTYQELQRLQKQG
jgi:NAD(P)-dependent dehydrogenase (short-subunit alcohol dehydrogenase family)